MNEINKEELNSLTIKVIDLITRHIMDGKYRDAIMGIKGVIVLHKEILAYMGRKEDGK